MAVEIHTRVPGNYMFEGLVSKNADLNSQEITITHTSAVYTLAQLSENAELVKLKFNFPEAFNGSLQLGNAADAEAYIADDDFPKSGADVILINKLLAASADIKLTVSGNTTGEGWFKLLWEV